MLRSILVPLDGSTFGEHALPLAAALARKAGAVLHLVHVHQVAVPVAVEGFAVMDVDDLHVRQDEMSYLTDVARRVAEKAPITLKTTLMEGDGDVVIGLKDFAKRESIDLVVMCTHARGAFGRFWLGSVADDLAHEMDRPLLLVRPHEGKPDLHRDYDLKSILVPLDGTMLAEQALEPAAELGKLFDAELDLVRVNLPPIMPTYLPEGLAVAPLPEPILELQEREEEEAKRYLSGVAEKVAAGGTKVCTHVIRQESPAAGILTEARADQADLIAMETHGRRGLARLFVGSVADAVVRGGTAPVLLHRAAPRR
jgi:nucleotide-binding universal stress UspA family protein